MGSQVVTGSDAIDARSLGCVRNRIGSEGAGRWGETVAWTRALRRWR